MKSFRDLHDSLTRIGFAGAAVSVAVMVLTFWYEVASRYFLEAPTTWGYAVAEYALAPMIFLAMPEMSRRNGHIAISYLIDALSERYQSILRNILFLATTLVCLIAAWLTGEETWRQFQQGIETISAFPIPKWCVSVFAPYALLSSAVYFLRHLVDGAPADNVGAF